MPGGRHEHWQDFIPQDGIETARVSEREKLPLWKKLNPLWWFGNVDDDPPQFFMVKWRVWPVRVPVWFARWKTGKEIPEGMSAYRQFNTNWVRHLVWGLRNPMHNFMFYVVGVSDRNYDLVGPKPVRVTLLSDLDHVNRKLRGFQWKLLWLNEFIVLPFVSYSGDHWRLYAGWRPDGALGFKITYVKE